MKKVYFCGQDNFGNRGCEALIRSNIKTLKLVSNELTFIVPSRNIANDSAQWPNSAAEGVQFINAEPIPWQIKLWSKAKRVIPALANVPPRFNLTQENQTQISSCDLFVMTGGDIISLDYGLESLFYWKGICEFAMSEGKTTVLWGASVGPFSSSPTLEGIMKQFLARFSLITVRETPSFDYLKQLGLTNIELVTDPAFVLDKEVLPADAPEILHKDKPLLGFNVSPLISKFRHGAEGKASLDQEVIQFLQSVLEKAEFNVLLIPHVDPLDGNDENSDSAYMSTLLAALRKQGFKSEQIALLPRTYNACQLKAIISQCAYFIGARTHATIAALSTGVPTTSIAYSIKAKGINKDLFGHISYVLDTPDLSSVTLNEHFLLLQQQRDQIIALLKKKLPEWKLACLNSAKFSMDRCG